jgi:cell wall-associated NlpC family hydrolase
LSEVKKYAAALKAAAVLVTVALSAVISPYQASANGNNQYIRDAVVRSAKSYLGTPYLLQYGWTCGYDVMDCECLNRHAIWDGTAKTKGKGLQLYYTLWGQIEGYYTGVKPYGYWDSRYLERGDLVFWDIDGNNQWGNDLDHTGVYVGNGLTVNAAWDDQVRYDYVYGTYDHHNVPYFVDVIDAHYLYG